MRKSKIRRRLIHSGCLHPQLSNCALSPAMTRTVVTTAGQRMPWTLLHHSASSLWGWVRSTCPNTATTTTTTVTRTASETPSATAPPHPQASPTRCRLGSVCALTSRRVASPSMMPTLCDLCGKVMWIAPAPCAQLSVS